MKIRSLLLGSIAAAGFATGAQAADLGVLTSLDVCDALGISGLTISSDTNCLQITGEVEYRFRVGDYRDSVAYNPSYNSGYSVTARTFSQLDSLTVIDDNFVGDEEFNTDYESRIRSFIQFAATADSDFGPAKAVIRIRDVQNYRTQNEGYVVGTSAVTASSAVVVVSSTGTLTASGTIAATASSAGGSTFLNYVGGAQADTAYELYLDEAYVAIGDSTVIMAGRKSSLLKRDDDAPFNYLGLFNSSRVGDTYNDGVDWSRNLLGDADKKPHVIQVVTDLGNGLTAGVGLEGFQFDASQPVEGGRDGGYLIGTLAYAGEGITASGALVATGVLNGEVDQWAGRAGVTAAFDTFKFRAAGAFDHDVDSDTTYWNVLATAEAGFDLFTLALSGEAADTDRFGDTDGVLVGVGGSIGFQITDGIKLNAGARWIDVNTESDDDETWQAELGLVASITETITATGAVGVYGGTFLEGSSDNDGDDTDMIYYGKAGLAWAPGGGFTSSIDAEVYSNGGVRGTFNAKKTFE